MQLVVLAVIVVALVGAVRFARRPHTVWALREGRAHVVRGKPSPSLDRAMSDIARLVPEASGRVLLSGQGDQRTVAVEGLGEDTAQRVRNVVYND